MWRAFFLAIGIFLIILGFECLGMERVVLRIRETQPAAAPNEPPKAGPAVTLTPAPWVPWTLLSTGAVTCLYSFTIPRKLAGK
jgi:hypothetical protein